MAGLDPVEPGAHDDDDADEAKRDRSDPWPCQPLAKEGRREQRGPDRRGELDRDQLGQRDQRQRIEPGELPDIVRDVAADMLQGAPCAHRREAAGHIDQRQQHDEADDRAHFQDLEDVQLGRRGAAGDRHRQERRDRAGHPQRGLEVGLLVRHARYLAGDSCGRNILWRPFEWANEIALNRRAVPAGARCGPCRMCSRSRPPGVRTSRATNRWRLRRARACVTARRQGRAGRPGHRC